MAAPARRKRRWLLIGGLIAGAALLLWLGLLARDALLLREDVQALQEFAATLPQPLQPDQIDVAFLRQRALLLHDHLAGVRQHALPLLALTPLLAGLPGVGGDMQAAPALLDMAVELTDLVQSALTAVQPHWPPSELSLPAITLLLQNLQPDTTAWAQEFDQVQASRSRIDVERLSPRLQSYLQRYDEVAALAQTGLPLLPIAPQILGVDRPRTYLILVQNEDELRATGGFLSAAARATVDAGRIISLTVEDSYAIDDFTTPYPDAPAPVNDYMGIDLLVFRDSNWSPDFPVAARQAISLYTQTRGGRIDGVIALNQRVVEGLIEGLGPVTLDGETIATAQDLHTFIQKSWNPSGQISAAEWVGQRKSFMGRLIQPLLDRVLNGSGDVDWPALAQALKRALQQRDLLVWLSDEALNAPLRQAHFDGGLRAAPGDYLMVVNSNMGFNKVDAVMQEAWYYTVTLPATGAPQAELTLVYTNPNAAGPACAQRPPDYDLNTRYEQMRDDCYWMYRRVLIPAGSELADATRHPTQPGELGSGRRSTGETRVTKENGKSVFGSFLIVPRGQTVVSQLRYALPADTAAARDKLRHYTLIWQRQPGAAARPVRVTVNWPEEEQLQSAVPKPVSVTSQSATFQFDLNADQEVRVTLAPK
jgi:hypothetical protein